MTAKQPEKSGYKASPHTHIQMETDKQIGRKDTLPKSSSQHSNCTGQEPASSLSTNQEPPRSPQAAG